MPGLPLAFVFLPGACSVTAQNREPIPSEFEGVWKITTVVYKNGEERPVPNDVGQQVENEYPFVELIVVANRIVFVKSTGDSTWCRAELVDTDPDVKIKILAGTHDDKSQTPEYGLLRLSGNELTFSCLPADMVSLDDDSTIAITARR